MTPQPPIEAVSAGAGPAVLAVDVGGTDLKVGVLDASGRLGPIVRRATPRSGDDPGTAVVTALAELMMQLRGAAVRVEALGLTVPGIVDEARGIGVRSTNLGWTDFPFRDRAAHATGLPVRIAHDVRAAGDAEHRLGAARGLADVAVVTVGTGIAAALFVGGVAYRGGGSAGELGHTVVDPNGPLCRCGQRGCLEAIASARAIADRYRAQSGRDLDAAGVLDRARNGDPIGVRVWDEAIDALTVALLQLTAIMAPEAIVLGGGLSEAGDSLVVPLRQRLDSLRTHTRAPRLLRAELGQDAGTWGAALAARDLLAGVEVRP